MNKLLIIFYVFLQFAGVTTPSVNNTTISSKPTAVATNNDELCQNVEIDITEKVMTVMNLKAPHVHVDVYRVDKNMGWKNIFSCNDNCGETLTVNVKERQHYIVHIKMFSKEWEKICERQMTLDATDNQTTCDDASVSTDGDMMTIGHLTAAHQVVEVYQVEDGGAWTKVFACNDICKRRTQVKINPKKKHIVLVKMFNRDWSPICEKQIDYQP
jgi:hypothetical protein